jgi:hypothetical protein
LAGSRPAPDPGDPGRHRCSTQDGSGRFFTNGLTPGRVPTSPSGTRAHSNALDTTQDCACIVPRAFGSRARAAALAMLDRRLGKRRLRALLHGSEEHPLVTTMYRLRWSAENVESDPGPAGPASWTSTRRRDP